MRCVLLVKLHIDQARAGRFMELLLENVQQSRLEEGCERFDVLVGESPDASVILYEVYKDDAAFQAHKQAAHYQAFVAARGDMITRSEFTLLRMAEENAP